MLPKKRRVAGLLNEKSLAPFSRRRRRSRAAIQKGESHHNKESHHHGNEVASA
jgi:hypothetical protein